MMMYHRKNAKEIQPLIFQIQPVSSAARLFDEGHILCVVCYHFLVILHYMWLRRGRNTDIRLLQQFQEQSGQAMTSMNWGGGEKKQ